MISHYSKNPAELYQPALTFNKITAFFAIITGIASLRFVIEFPDLLTATAVAFIALKLILNIFIISAASLAVKRIKIGEASGITMLAMIIIADLIALNFVSMIFVIASLAVPSFRDTTRPFAPDWFTQIEGAFRSI